jgi:hypothetical protein
MPFLHFLHTQLIETLKAIELGDVQTYLLQHKHAGIRFAEPRRCKPR